MSESWAIQLSRLVIGRLSPFECHAYPPAPAKLERIAGCGSSPVVQYQGTGDYFLDLPLARGLGVACLPRRGLGERPFRA